MDDAEVLLRDGAGAIDVGEYCRRVEDHLARVNEGQIIRIVGTGFELVRGWARAGIPLSVVCYGIDRKAERHRSGRAQRALRLEFCEPDVQAAFAQWRRSVGVSVVDLHPDDQAVDVDVAASEASAARERRQPSLARQLERAEDRLVRAAGRLETPVPLREHLVIVLERVVELRDQSKSARSGKREQIASALAALDRDMLSAARSACGSELIAIEHEAAAELAPYRTRLSTDAWQRSLAASVDRLLRDRFGLPVLDPARL